MSPNLPYTRNDGANEMPGLENVQVELSTVILDKTDEACSERGTFLRCSDLAIPGEINPDFEIKL